MKVNQLLGIVYDAGDSKESLAKLLGISTKTLNRRLKNGDLRTNEVSKIIKKYGIENPTSIFF